MPANIKYLSSPSQRFAKITAGLLGGYVLSVSFHMFLASCFMRQAVVMTMSFTGFILWCVLFIVAFLVKNGWKIWALYLLISCLCLAGIYMASL